MLRAGHSVVLDAVFASRTSADGRSAGEKGRRAVRGPVARRAEGGGAGPRHRPKGDASDATPAVVERQFGYDLGEIRRRRA